MSGSPTECIRCGTPVDDRAERMVVLVKIARGDAHEVLDEIVLCGPCGREAEDHLALETNYRRSEPE